MSRIHDMGGRFGDGVVIPDFGKEAVFEKDWHARALAVTVASGFLGQWNLDESRHSREKLSPTDYSKFSYYEKWISALSDILVAKGLISVEELQSLHGARALDSLSDRVFTAEKVADGLSKGGPTLRDSAVVQLFRIGDSVKSKLAENRFLSGGHTRLPKYAAQKAGKIVGFHGSHIFPDAHAHGGGEAPEPLYTVAFEASTLWEHAENPSDLVMLDLWQSYLEPL
ncbi:MAG: nitrile hydratase subunit beta [Paracoccaceae bacterium]|nr:nitrile hydratase subunit beta [Paracoccaceae bacterium]